MDDRPIRPGLCHYESHTSLDAIGCPSFVPVIVSKPAMIDLKTYPTFQPSMLQARSRRSMSPTFILGLLQMSKLSEEFLTKIGINDQHVDPMRQVNYVLVVEEDTRARETDNLFCLPRGTALVGHSCRSTAAADDQLAIDLLLQPAELQIRR